ncbi:MAG TPA: ABC transporter ATP-binding protein [Gemmatimonadaceae bacterium]|nr:ABC transporter ATP-binding protein [Gemmatimonadaceae bacterium]
MRAVGTDGRPAAAGDAADRTPRHHLARRAVLLFARPIAGRTLLTLGATVAVAGAAASEPLLLRALVDQLTAAAGHPASRAASGVAAFVVLFALVLTARLVGSAWITTSTWRVKLGFEYQLRQRVAAKMSVLSPAVQADIGTGGLRYAVDSSAPQTAGAFTDVCFRLPQIITYVAVATWGMMRLHAPLAAIVLCLVPVPALVATFAARRQTRRERMYHRFWTGLWSWYGEVLHGMGTVRAFARERAEERAFTRRMRWAFASIQRGVGVDARVTLAAGLTELAARVAVLTWAGILVVDGHLTVGALLAFLGYIGGVFAPVQQLVDLYPTLRKAGVALDAVFAVLDAEEEAPDVAGAEEAPILRGAVTFEGVRFAYRGDRMALDGLDVAVKPGETVALVGPSGSGKSTVLRLMQRIHHPTEGRVLLDGHDLRFLRIEGARRQFGVVPQEVVLFNASVAANIAYARPTATRDEVVAAAVAAGAHEFIMQLPGGYESGVGEGGRSLSGGQRQRIAIARAFLVDPAILLLDEATAALDPVSERAVQDALKALRGGRTTFIVAHRLNTVRDADRILVLEHGRVVGDGTHDELLERCPTYATLVHTQLAVEKPAPTAAAAAAAARDETAAEAPAPSRSPEREERPQISLVA